MMVQRQPKETRQSMRSHRETGKIAIATRMEYIRYAKTFNRAMQTESHAKAVATALKKSQALKEEHEAERRVALFCAVFFWIFGWILVSRYVFKFIVEDGQSKSVNVFDGLALGVGIGTFILCALAVLLAAKHLEFGIVKKGKVGKSARVVRPTQIGNIPALNLFRDPFDSCKLIR